MDRVKGASVADQAAHRIYDEIVLPRNHGGLCARCGAELIKAIEFLAAELGQTWEG